MTEEMLATLFQECGTVMDCRICGDPNSAMRFAFVEFLEDHAAQQVRAQRHTRRAGGAAACVCPCWAGSMCTSCSLGMQGSPS